MSALASEAEAAKISDEWTDHIFKSLQAFADERGATALPVGAVLGGLIEMAGTILRTLPMDKQAGATATFTEDLIAGVGLIEGKRSHLEFLEEMRVWVQREIDEEAA